MPPCTLSRQYRMPVSDARQYRMPSHGHRASRTRARNVARVVVCSPSEARDELFVLGGGLRAGSDDKLPEEVVVVLSIPPVYYVGFRERLNNPHRSERLQQASVRYLCCRPRGHVLAPSRLDASRLACGAWAAAGASARQASGHDPQAGRAPTSGTHLQTGRTHSRRTKRSARHASMVQLGRAEYD